MFIHDSNTYGSKLNSDFKEINDLVFSWKISFNLDRSKQTQKIIFGSQSKKRGHLPLVFNNNNVSQANSRNHRGLL